LRCRRPSASAVPGFKTTAPRHAASRAWSEWQQNCAPLGGRYARPPATDDGHRRSEAASDVLLRSQPGSARRSSAVSAPWRRCAARAVWILGCARPARWEPGSKRWLFQPRRMGPLIRCSGAPGSTWTRGVNARRRKCVKRPARRRFSDFCPPGCPPVYAPHGAYYEIPTNSTLHRIDIVYAQRCLTAVVAFRVDDGWLVSAVGQGDQNCPDCGERSTSRHAGHTRPPRAAIDRACRDRHSA